MGLESTLELFIKSFSSSKVIGFRETLAPDGKVTDATSLRGISFNKLFKISSSSSFVLAIEKLRFIIVYNKV